MTRLSRVPLALGAAGMTLALANAALGQPAPCPPGTVQDPTDSSRCLSVITQKATPPPTVKLQVQSDPPAEIRSVADGKRLCDTGADCTLLLGATVVIAKEGFANRTLLITREPPPKITLVKCPKVEVRDLLPDATITVQRLDASTTATKPASRLQQGTQLFSPPSEDSAPRVLKLGAEDLKKETSIERLIARGLGLRADNGCALPTGRYAFTFDHKDHYPKKREVELLFDHAVELSGKLERRHGTLLIVSAIGQVRVLVDGQPRAILPAAGPKNLYLEIPGVPVGERYSVKLEPVDGGDLTEKAEFWGSFKREEQSVSVRDGQVTLVDFRTTEAEPPDQPSTAGLTTSRPLLDELCDRNPRACTTLGWAYRWGVGGKADNRMAALSFARACAGRPPSSNPFSGFLSGAVDRREAEARSRARLQGCVAYHWMVEVGLVEEVSLVAPGEPRFQCAPASQFPDDPITPCIRRHLSLESQRIHDPTLYVEHDVDTGFGTGSDGLPVSVTIALGPSQRLIHIGYSYTASGGFAAFDAGLDVGMTQVFRWDAGFRRQDWMSGAGLMFHVGLLIRPVPQFYIALHGRLGPVWLQPDPDHVLGAAAIYGGRVALGVTQGLGSRRGVFAELGLLLEGFGNGLLEPTTDEIIARATSTRNVGELRSSWDRNRQSPHFVATPAVSLGYTFQ